MNMPDKPNGKKYGWHLLGTSYPFSTPWLTLRQDRVSLDNVGEIAFTYVESKGAVGVVPVTASGDIVLIRQYRFTVDEVCWEVPAGGLHDTEDASIEQAALDELRQEIGGTCRRIEYVTYFYTGVGQSSQAFHVFLALGVEITEKQTLEATEHIEIHPTPARQALHMAHSGQIKDGASALTILLCEERLKELGYV